MGRSNKGVLGDALDLGLNYFTYGMVGFNKDGLTTGMGVDALKEVTGAAAAEEQLEQQAEVAEQERQKLQAEEQQRQQQRRTRNLQASQSAANLRGSSLGNTSSDFLGV